MVQSPTNIGKGLHVKNSKTQVLSQYLQGKTEGQSDPIVYVKNMDWVRKGVNSDLPLIFREDPEDCHKPLFTEDHNQKILNEAI